MCKRPLPWVHAAYTQSLRKAQPQRWFSLYIFFFVLYLSVGSLPPKRAVKKHNTKLKLSYIFGKLEAELAGRKRKSPVVCVSVFVVFFFILSFHRQQYQLYRRCHSRRRSRRRSSWSFAFPCFLLVYFSIIVSVLLFWCNQIANAKSEASSQMCHAVMCIHGVCDIFLTLSLSLASNLAKCCFWHH